MNMKWLDHLSLPMVAAAAIFLGLSPFAPEPHLWEKLKLLAAGNLVRPLDMVDLLFHGAPSLLLVLKLLRRRTGS